MTPDRRRGFFNFNATTWKVLAVCALITYAFGLGARVPTYQDKTLGFFFSLYVDTLIVFVALPFIAAIMRSKYNRLNLVSIALMVLAAAGCAVVVLSLNALTIYFFPFLANPHQNRPLMVTAYYTIVISIWALAAFSVKTHALATEEALNAANAAHAATASELKRLRTQLDPHFLFNALNTAVVEIPHRPKRAVLMLRELSNYLRYSLDTAEVQLVPVSVELAMIRSFLRIQDIRFGAKLKHTITVRDDAKRRTIPAFLLQPLIENAAKFGLPDDDNILRIAIAVALEESNLVITVSNTGELTLSNAAHRGTGTGLSNLRSRLALHYPDRHSFEMAQVGRDVCVTCVLRGEPN
jgi:hypothetical protein